MYIRSANNSKSSLETQILDGETYAKQISMQLSIIEDTQSSGHTPVNERPAIQGVIHLIGIGRLKRSWSPVIAELVVM